MSYPVEYVTPIRAMKVYYQPQISQSFRTNIATKMLYN